MGAFTVTRVIDQDERQLRREIDVFLSGRSVSDLVVVYLSCHGVLDRRGRLYFAAVDTHKTQLASTGIPSAWLLDQLDDCRARRQVLILDCCFSGAFAHGSKGGADLDLERRLAGHGRGRAVLTASRSGEYSFEGKALAGAAVAGSVFTTGLVEGLRTGAADLGGDGHISLDEAYDYAYRYVLSRSASQTPQRWLYGGEGAIVLARSPAWAAANGAAAQERKLATVLFADLAGAAELAADQDPERVRAVLDRFYDAMAGEVERAGGTAGKFAGDAVMAAFGVPASHEDDAERALQAALGMQQRLGELSGGRLALRIGVNTGDVVAGKPREGSSLSTGDAVNVGALLERAAAPGEILVGERTVAAARGAFEFAEPATVEATGKPGGIGAAARASAQATEVAAGLTPHHRLHAAHWRNLLATLTGRWDEVRARAAEAKRTVDANLAAATPCVANVSILLNCATASALAGDEDEARRLESKAHGLGMKGDRWYQGWFDPAEIRLALARHELGGIPELAAHELDWDWEPASTFLDALAALVDRERIEAEAPKWLQPGTFTEAFALRALGIARDDRALLRQALARFEGMGLSWHAEQTRRLL